jgi:nifR3 family TIM-barrel protein
MNSIDFDARIREAKLMLPPLADYTDYPYRRVLAGFNPPFIITEMISASALIHGGAKIHMMLTRASKTQYEGVQLVGADPELMSKAARIVEGQGFDYVDINMGCTINKVARQGAGISLMGDEEMACRIASSIIEAVGIPVTCKMRLGLNRSCFNAISLSKKLEELGIAAVTVHGRSGEKKWGLPVDYKRIRDIIEVLSIPVIANGGVFTGEDAKKMIEKTGATGVMPGRGLIGNPWLIPEITVALTGGNYAPPTLSEKKKTCLLHIEYLRDYYGDKDGAVRMRRILPKYFSGCKNIKSLRKDVQTISTSAEVEEIIAGILDDGAQGPYYTCKDTH